MPGPLGTLIALQHARVMKSACSWKLKLVVVVMSAVAISVQSAWPSSDKSVTWQNDVRHDGYDSSSTLVPPLTLKWKRDFSAQGVESISYPVIAEGMIFITTTTSSFTFTKKLIALNEQTGRKVWSVSIPGTYGFANAAYDAGKVFVVNFD